MFLFAGSGPTMSIVLRNARITHKSLTTRDNGARLGATHHETALSSTASIAGTLHHCGLIDLLSAIHDSASAHPIAPKGSAWRGEEVGDKFVHLGRRKIVDCNASHSVCATRLRGGALSLSLGLSAALSLTLSLALSVSPSAGQGLSLPGSLILAFIIVLVVFNGLQLVASGLGHVGDDLIVGRHVACEILEGRRHASSSG